MTLHVKINTVPALNCKNFKIFLRNIPFKNKIGQNMFFGLNLGISKYQNMYSLIAGSKMQDTLFGSFPHFKD